MTVTAAPAPIPPLAPAERPPEELSERTGSVVLVSSIPLAPGLTMGARGRPPEENSGGRRDVAFFILSVTVLIVDVVDVDSDSALDEVAVGGTGLGRGLLGSPCDVDTGCVDVEDDAVVADSLASSSAGVSCGPVFLANLAHISSLVGPAISE